LYLIFIKQAFENKDFSEEKRKNRKKKIDFSS